MERFGIYLKWNRIYKLMTFCSYCLEDPQLLGNFHATPAFQRDFGYEFEGEYIISAAWQSGLSMGKTLSVSASALSWLAIPWSGTEGRRRSPPASSEHAVASSSSSSPAPWRSS